MRAIIRLLPLAVAMACSRPRVAGFRETGRFHAPNMHTLYPDVTHFVVAPRSALSDRNAVLEYSRATCAGDAQVCFVLYWADDTKSAASFPIDAAQTASMVASYSRNRSTGHDGLQCYDFGSTVERCRARQ